MTWLSSRRSWAKPSLSRDFLLLAAAIVCVMLLTSAWVTWLTYSHHAEQVLVELQREADRIEETMGNEISGTGYLINAISKQIIQEDPTNLPNMARLLQSFATGDPSYALWSWSDATKHIVVSSRDGILETPVDITDRDYIRQTVQTPWQVQIGTPVEGRVSGRWVIPLSIGVTDGTGRYVGTLTASVDIGSLSERIRHIVYRRGISFAVVSKTLLPLTVVSEDDRFVVEELPFERLRDIPMDRSSGGVMSRAGLLSQGKMFSYYHISGAYPYLVIVGYDTQDSDSTIHGLLWPRLIQIGVVGGVLIFLLWLIRARVIAPVMELSAITARITGGHRYMPLSGSGPQEIETLSLHIGQMADYIQERRLLEAELHSKIEALQREGVRDRVEHRQRASLLSGLLGEYKKTLRTINGLSQVLKDQLYGPLDNKKYAQYAADIHQAGTSLELMVRKLIALSRVDAAAVTMRQERVKLAQLLENARRFALESLGSTPEVAVHIEASPGTERTVLTDPLYLQQALVYVICYLAEQDTPVHTVTLHVLEESVIGLEGGCLLAVGRGDVSKLTPEAIGAAFSAPLPALRAAEENSLPALHLALAGAMMHQQQLLLAVHASLEAGTWVLVRVPPARVNDTTSGAA